jgi:outer membrane protein OmpA-like peptidoglycan-associated protein
MKTLSLLIISSILSVIFPHIASGQVILTEIDTGYYAIVGTFAVRQNAVKFTERLRKSGLDAQCLHTEETNLYSVFTLFSKDKQTAVDHAVALRSKPEFQDAWVKKFPTDHPEPDAGQALEILSSVANVPEEDRYTQIPVYFRVTNSTDRQRIAASVQVFDSEKILYQVAGNTAHALSLSPRQLKNITILCDAFGYRKAQIDYHEADSLKNPFLATASSSDTVVIDIDMIRYHAGDIFALYQVYFYNDAAIMQRRSIPQLEQVVQMLDENPGMKIRLHGHTNGNYHGPIIRSKTKTNFFAMGAETETRNGSARELSRVRANVVRDYLISRGIASNRLELKGWGGKRPLFDKHDDVNAVKNLRVEIEVLTD